LMTALFGTDAVPRRAALFGTAQIKQRPHSTFQRG
jgi:hypothetical protein